ncbi:MAG TPA: dihydroorotate dehydrogenase-like protein [Bacteroidales bacterium]
MVDLKTSFAGLEIKNPIIVGASNLVNSVDNLKLMEESGAAAIVYKSLFEEQIQLERLELDENLNEYRERNAEMISLFPDIEHAGPSEHLMNLRLAKESVSIPVIASLNCVFTETWIDYARQLQDTGIDALELNFFAIPKDFKFDGRDIVSQQLEIFKAVKNAVKIPISIKFSPFYANILNVIKQFDNEGADSVVVFNRFLQPDIDIENEIHINSFQVSTPGESLLAMRYAGMLYRNIKASISCNGGIHSGKDIIKMILAGADSVQVVSTLYKNKISYIKTLLSEITAWMEARKYKSLNDFKGKLSQAKVNNPFIYKRAQYIDILQKSSEIFKKYPLR